MSISSTEPQGGTYLPRATVGETTKTDPALFASRLERLMDQGLLKRDPETDQKRDARTQNDTRSQGRRSAIAGDAEKSYEKSLDDGVTDKERYDRQRLAGLERVSRERSDVTGTASTKAFPRPFSASDGTPAFSAAAPAIPSGLETVARESSANRSVFGPENNIRTQNAPSSGVLPGGTFPMTPDAAPSLNVFTLHPATSQAPVSMPVPATPMLPANLSSGAVALTVFSMNGKVLDEDRESEAVESPETSDRAETPPGKTAPSQKRGGLFADILKKHVSPRRASTARNTGAAAGNATPGGPLAAGTLNNASIIEGVPNGMGDPAPATPSSLIFEPKFPGSALRESPQEPQIPSREDGRTKADTNGKLPEPPVVLPFPILANLHAESTAGFPGLAAGKDAELDGATEINGDAATRRKALLQRVVAAVQAAHARRGPVRIRLHPESLGRVAVNVHIREGGVSASLFATTEEARRMLLDNVAELKQNLDRLGLHLERFDVSLVNTPEEPSGIP